MPGLEAPSSSAAPLIAAVSQQAKTVADSSSAEIGAILGVNATAIVGAGAAAPENRLSQQRAPFADEALRLAHLEYQGRSPWEQWPHIVKQLQNSRLEWQRQRQEPVTDKRYDAPKANLPLPLRFGPEGEDGNASKLILAPNTSAGCTATEAAAARNSATTIADTYKYAAAHACEQKPIYERLTVLKDKQHYQGHMHGIRRYSAPDIISASDSSSTVLYQSCCDADRIGVDADHARIAGNIRRASTLPYAEVNGEGRCKKCWNGGLQTAVTSVFARGGAVLVGSACCLPMQHQQQGNLWIRAKITTQPEAVGQSSRFTVGFCEAAAIAETPAAGPLDKRQKAGVQDFEERLGEIYEAEHHRHSTKSGNCYLADKNAVLASANDAISVSDSLSWSEDDGRMNAAAAAAAAIVPRAAASPRPSACMRSDHRFKLYTSTVSAASLPTRCEYSSHLPVFSLSPQQQLQPAQQLCSLSSASLKCESVAVEVAEPASHSNQHLPLCSSSCKSSRSSRSSESSRHIPCAGSLKSSGACLSPPLFSTDATAEILPQPEAHELRPELNHCTVNDENSFSAHSSFIDISDGRKAGSSNRSFASYKRFLSDGSVWAPSSSGTDGRDVHAAGVEATAAAVGRANVKGQEAQKCCSSSCSSSASFCGAAEVECQQPLFGVEWKKNSLKTARSGIEKATTAGEISSINSLQTYLSSSSTTVPVYGSGNFAAAISDSIYVSSLQLRIRSDDSVDCECSVAADLEPASACADSTHKSESQEIRIESAVAAAVVEENVFADGSALHTPTEDNCTEKKETDGENPMTVKPAAVESETNRKYLDASNSLWIPFRTSCGGVAAGADAASSIKINTPSQAPILDRLPGLEAATSAAGTSIATAKSLALVAAEEAYRSAAQTERHDGLATEAAGVIASPREKCESVATSYTYSAAINPGPAAALSRLKTAKTSSAPSQMNCLSRMQQSPAGSSTGVSLEKPRNAARSLLSETSSQQHFQVLLQCARREAPDKTGRKTDIEYGCSLVRRHSNVPAIASIGSASRLPLAGTNQGAAKILKFLVPLLLQQQRGNPQDLGEQYQKSWTSQLQQHEMQQVTPQLPRQSAHMLEELHKQQQQQFQRLASLRSCHSHQSAAFSSLPRNYSADALVSPTATGVDLDKVTTRKPSNNVMQIRQPNPSTFASFNYTRIVEEVNSCDTRWLRCALWYVWQLLKKLEQQKLLPETQQQHARQRLKAPRWAADKGSVACASSLESSSSSCSCAASKHGQKDSLHSHITVRRNLSLRRAQSSSSLQNYTSRHVFSATLPSSWIVKAASSGRVACRRQEDWGITAVTSMIEAKDDIRLGSSEKGAPEFPCEARILKCKSQASTKAHFLTQGDVLKHRCREILHSNRKNFRSHSDVSFNCKKGHYISRQIEAATMKQQQTTSLSAAASQKLSHKQRRGWHQQVLQQQQPIQDEICKRQNQEDHHLAVQLVRQPLRNAVSKTVSCSQRILQPATRIRCVAATDIDRLFELVRSLVQHVKPAAEALSKVASSPSVFLEVARNEPRYNNNPESRESSTESMSPHQYCPGLGARKQRDRLQENSSGEALSKRAGDVARIERAESSDKIKEESSNKLRTMALMSSNNNGIDFKSRRALPPAPPNLTIEKVSSDSNTNERKKFTPGLREIYDLFRLVPKLYRAHAPAFALLLHDSVLPSLFPLHPHEVAAFTNLMLQQPRSVAAILHHMLASARCECCSCCSCCCRCCCCCSKRSFVGFCATKELPIRSDTQQQYGRFQMLQQQQQQLRYRQNQKRHSQQTSGKLQRQQPQQGPYQDSALRRFKSQPEQPTYVNLKKHLRTFHSSSCIREDARDACCAAQSGILTTAATRCRDTTEKFSVVEGSTFCKGLCIYPDDDTVSNGTLMYGQQPEHYQDEGGERSSCDEKPISSGRILGLRRHCRGREYQLLHGNTGVQRKSNRRTSYAAFDSQITTPRVYKNCIEKKRLVKEPRYFEGDQLKQQQEGRVKNWHYHATDLSPQHQELPLYERRLSATGIALACQRCQLPLYLQRQQHLCVSQQQPQLHQQPQRWQSLVQERPLVTQKLHSNLSEPRVRQVPFARQQQKMRIWQKEEEQQERLQHPPREKVRREMQLRQQHSAMRLQHHMATLQQQLDQSHMFENLQQHRNERKRLQKTPSLQQEHYVRHQHYQHPYEQQRPQKVCSFDKTCSRDANQIRATDSFKNSRISTLHILQASKLCTESALGYDYDSGPAGAFAESCSSPVKNARLHRSRLPLPRNATVARTTGLTNSRWRGLQWEPFSNTCFVHGKEETVSVDKIKDAELANVESLAATTRDGSAGAATHATGNPTAHGEEHKCTQSWTTQIQKHALCLCKCERWAKTAYNVTRNTVTASFYDCLNDGSQTATHQYGEVDCPTNTGKSTVELTTSPFATVKSCSTTSTCSILKRDFSYGCPCRRSCSAVSEGFANYQKSTCGVKTFPCQHDDYTRYGLGSEHFIINKRSNEEKQCWAHSPCNSRIRVGFPVKSNKICFTVEPAAAKANNAGTGGAKAAVAFTSSLKAFTADAADAGTGIAATAAVAAKRPTVPATEANAAGRAFPIMCAERATYKVVPSSLSACSSPVFCSRCQNKSFVQSNITGSSGRAVLQRRYRVASSPALKLESTDSLLSQKRQQHKHQEQQQPCQRRHWQTSKQPPQQQQMQPRHVDAQEGWGNRQRQNLRLQGSAVSADEFSRQLCALFTGSVGAPSVLAYVHRLQELSQLGAHEALMALLLLSRVMARHPYLPFCAWNAHRLLLAAFLIITKTVSDRFYNNGLWARFGGVKVSELNRLERAFLLLLDHHCFLSLEHFAAGFALLKRVRSVLPADLITAPSSVRVPETAAVSSATLLQRQHKRNMTHIPAAAVKSSRASAAPSDPRVSTLQCHPRVYHITSNIDRETVRKSFSSKYFTTGSIDDSSTGCCFDSTDSAGLRSEEAEARQSARTGSWNSSKCWRKSNAAAACPKSSLPGLLHGPAQVAESLQQEPQMGAVKFSSKLDTVTLGGSDTKCAPSARDINDEEFTLKKVKWLISGSHNSTSNSSIGCGSSSCRRCNDNSEPNAWTGLAVDDEPETSFIEVADPAAYGRLLRLRRIPLCVLMLQRHQSSSFSTSNRSCDANRCAAASSHCGKKLDVTDKSYTYHSKEQLKRGSNEFFDINESYAARIQDDQSAISGASQIYSSALSADVGKGKATSKRIESNSPPTSSEDDFDRECSFFSSNGLSGEPSAAAASASGAVGAAGCGKHTSNQEWLNLLDNPYANLLFCFCPEVQEKLLHLYLFESAYKQKNKQSDSVRGRGRGAAGPQQNSCAPRSNVCNCLEQLYEKGGLAKGYTKKITAPPFSW